jgi:threonine/homoserine/homoserine lactone efflux protein
VFGTHDLLLFVLAGILLNVTPGPDMLYIIGRSTAQGWRAGAAATLGVSAGCSVHITAAALGISALITASATAFAILKLAGAAYLIYVGISMIRSPRIAAGAVRASAPVGLRAIFWQGFLTNALNPKVALFFLAFLPQFIEVDAPMKPLAFLFLGMIFTFTATLWNLFVAWSAARMSAIMGSRAVAWFQRAIGAFFVILGVRLLAVEGAGSKNFVGRGYSTILPACRSNLSRRESSFSWRFVMSS